MKQGMNLSLDEDIIWWLKKVARAEGHGNESKVACRYLKNAKRHYERRLADKLKEASRDS